MRLGYFGGSFNPPHRGHLAVARLARDAFALDRVLLAPTARQPLKRSGPAAPWPDRLRMTQLLCAGEPGLEASAIDGPQPNNAPNYTVDTLQRLRHILASEPGSAASQLFAILGADAFLGLPQWREPETLLHLAEWIIISRPGFAMPPPDAMPWADPSRIHRLETLADPTQATDLRRCLARGEALGQPCQDALPAPVLTYIQLHHLYGT